MAEMTNEEAKYWDDYFTKNPPELGPNGSGWISRRESGRVFRPHYQELLDSMPRDVVQELARLRLNELEQDRKAHPRTET